MKQIYLDYEISGEELFQQQNIEGSNMVNGKKIFTSGFFFDPIVFDVDNYEVMMEHMIVISEVRHIIAQVINAAIDTYISDKHGKEFLIGWAAEKLVQYGDAFYDERLFLKDIWSYNNKHGAIMARMVRFSDLRFYLMEIIREMFCENMSSNRLNKNDFQSISELLIKYDEFFSEQWRYLEDKFRRKRKNIMPRNVILDLQHRLQNYKYE